uniref:At2g35280-like TPR domain-containing protein n=1 Tax=Lactuca sativa TaxID=4236 RepID=A0A9R1XA99_LACSA|nr:hypothetical protein LSAT_V11C500244430 [Lactuca sativa]
MSNTRCCSSLDDLPVEILTRIIVMLGSKKMYVAGEESEVFKEASLHMVEGICPKELKVDLFIYKCSSHKNVDFMYRQGVVCEKCFCNEHFDLGMSLLHDVGDKDHLEAIYLLGMICISRG